jgi:hypothetical protein
MKSKLMAAAILAIAAGSGAAHADTTLVVGIAADPTGLDPEAVENNTSGFIMSTVYDSLVRYKPGTTEAAPGIAESWETSADGLTYTFHLRHGAQFSDGTPLDAKAVIWNVDRLLNKANPEYIYNTGPVEGYIDFTYGDVASYRAVDDNTVEFKFKQPSAPFLSSLGMVWNGLVSPAAAAKWGKDYRNHPVGSGPFVLREWRPRDRGHPRCEPGLLGRQAEGRSPDLQGTARSAGGRAVAEAGRDPDPGRPRHPGGAGDQDGCQRRAADPAGPRRLRRGAAGRRAAVQRQARAPGAELRGRQGRDQQGAVLRPRGPDDLAAAGSAMGLRQEPAGISL